PGLPVVRNLTVAVGAGMHGGEHPAVLLLHPQPLADLVEHIIVAPLRRPVLGRAVDARLRVVPVATSVVVQVAGAVGESTQSIAEDRGTLARLYAAEADPPDLDPPPPRITYGSRAKVHRASDPTPGRNAPVSRLAVDLHRQRPRAVDL